MVYAPNNDIWLKEVERIPSPNCNERQCAAEDVVEFVDLLVIHNISLPPAIQESDFNNRYVEDFFCNQLDSKASPIFDELASVKVSSHLYIRRDGTAVQFVPLNLNAWHAGLSQHNGRNACNDFSIGIEMQGTDVLPYTDQQYQTLIKLTLEIQQIFTNISIENIVGHVHISPGRKTDPGDSFNWLRYKDNLVNDKRDI